MSRSQLGIGFGGATAILVGGLMFVMPAGASSADQPTLADGTSFAVAAPSPAEICAAIDVEPICFSLQTSASPPARDGLAGPVDPTGWIDRGDHCVQRRGSSVVACAG